MLCCRHMRFRQSAGFHFEEGNGERNSEVGRISSSPKEVYEGPGAAHCVV